MDKRNLILSIAIVFSTIAYAFADFGYGSANLDNPYSTEYVLSNPSDTIPLQERYDNFIDNQNQNPFDLKDPPIIEKEVEYDPESGQYIVYERIGDEYYRAPTYMTFDEYLKYQEEKQERDYFQKLSGLVDANASIDGGLIDPIKKLNLDENLLDRLFGGTAIDIKPTGKVGLVFGFQYFKTENPAQIQRRQGQVSPLFNMSPLEMNVNGKIGDKLNLDMGYNPNATFDFDNQMKINYSSDDFSEDEIIKKIEAGNVTLPLRSNLIQGSESLFGIKTELQFGRFWLTAIASSKNSQQEELTIQNGAQEQFFEVQADEYDEFRHFFLSHYNREQFETSMTNLPQINSLFRINKMDVWITNDNNNVNDASREIVAFADIGEATRITNDVMGYGAVGIPRNRDLCGDNELPSNDSNDLYERLKDNEGAKSLDRAVSTLQGLGFQQGQDYEKVRARRLNQSEYTFHPQLGFISVNINLRPDQVLAVSYEYTYNGKTYIVGDFASDVPNSNGLDSSFNDPNQPQQQQDTLEQQNVLFTKLLKGTTPRIDLPLWDLMMKNVYSVGAFQVDREEFKLDIFYDDPGQAEKRFLPSEPTSDNPIFDGEPLLRVFNLDNLNVQGDPCPDGIFDFVEGVTINTRNGRIMFPVLEPFGNDLAEQINDPVLEQKYSYQFLYDSTLTRAREYPELNRFRIRGKYQSSVSSEISLGAFNLPEGSVRVFAGGVELLPERGDVEIDYNIGRVRILNEAYLNSGSPITVRFENTALFGFQQKTMIGLRGEYRFNEDVSLGGTYMHLFERPFTQKVNIGDDPINNRIYGLDFSMTKDAPWLTKALDALPLLQTKAPSTFNLLAEGAYLKPGHAKAINEGGDDADKEGILMLDDFEGSTNSIILGIQPNQWFLASTPQNDAQNNNPLFPEGSLINDPKNGVNRAKLSWYDLRLIQTPTIDSTDTDASYFANISQLEVFPNRQLNPLDVNNYTTFDLTYYPRERGPYNYDLPGGGTQYSAGLDFDGNLEAPETRWAGIMREITANNDFEQSNVEFIEFWMLSPFLDKRNDANISGAGDLYINLGNVSEDVIRDSRQAFENGLPGVVNNVDRPTRETALGRVPEVTPVVNGFNLELEDREAQDVGLDGLDDSGEASKFEEIIDIYNNAGSIDLSPNALQRILDDPAADNFVSFNDPNVNETGNPLDRFKDFNGTQGNSPQNIGNSASTSLRQSTNTPDAEDLNNDKSLNETEAYFQYKIPLVPDGDGGVELNEFITDVRRPQGTNGRVWYRFRIPLDQYTSAVGGIQDFRSIRFFRMYMTGFDETVTLRFANLELVRSQWRRYLRNLEENGIGSIDPDGNTTLFDVNALNIEENGGRCPFNYVLPPGIQREQSLGAFPNILQNEQSLSVGVCNLQDGDARAIYKLLDFDMRVYKRLKMFLHAETTNGEDLETGKMTAFMRIGSDFENNYYEYEIPLDFSNPELLANCEATSGNNANNAIDDDYVDEVWKENNEFDFPFDLLKNVKVARNESGASVTQLYEEIDPEKPQNRVRVIGSPTLGRARGVMIGIRNTEDDGVPACAEIWVNELRVSGFDERDGMAGLLRMDMQLADLGQVAFSGQATSIGWGGIEDRVTERSRERITEYEATANLELGRFLPEKSGIKIPFLASISNNTSTPEFDPYDTDLKLQDKIDRAATIQEKDSIRTQAKDVTNIRSFNFTNVRKERTKEGTPMPWDISNFSFTYARSVTEHSDPIVENERIDQYQGAIDYNFNIKPLYIQPFKKIIKKDKYLKLISEMNFNLLPNKFSFNTIMDRNKTETSYRFVDGPEYTKTFFNKRFTWDRNYNLDWDLTKSLKIRFDARNQAVIDELKNFDFDTNEAIPNAELKDFIWDGIRDFGRTKNYDHSLNVSYNVPLKKIPLLDWITVKANYTADYSWSASALNTDSLGNVISNAQDRKLNADFNFESLYKKSKYLDKINRGNRKSRGRSSSRLSRGLKKDDPSDKKKDKKKKKTREPSKAEKILIRPLMTIRKAKLSYQETFGTVLPGFMPQTELFGLSKGFDAPGLDFVSGYQPNTAWFDQAFENGWMTESTFLAEDINQQYNQNINASLSLEPINDLRVELTATRQFTENFTETFKDTDKSDGVVRYEHLLPRYVGSMNVSYSALNTLFKSGNDEILGLFAQFEDNREIISTNINGAGGTHSEDDIFGDYTDGYGRKQLNVLIPAFLAAYTDKDPVELANTLYPVNETNTSNIDLFNLMPKINWNLSYNGLSKLPKMKEIFKSFDISHSYKSNMIVNSFNTDLDYEFGKRNPDTDNFFSTFEIPQLSIAEAFSPLIGIGFELQNSMSFDLSYNKSRTLDMRFNDLTLTESRSDEITVGFGYTKEDVYIGFLKNLGQPGGSKKKKKKKSGLDKDKDTAPEEEFSSDLTFQFDLSFRDDASYQHRLDQDSTEPTRGTRDFRITPSIDYDINEQLNIQMYFEYTRTVPKVTTSFPSTRAEGGIRLLFTL